MEDKRYGNNKFDLVTYLGGLLEENNLLDEQAKKYFNVEGDYIGTGIIKTGFDK